jgi:hypothetical protein
MPSDPLNNAISRVLWPFLKGAGFVRSSGKTFARERNGVIQQVWVDAKGVAGRKSTRITLCCTFPYAAPNGYMDPHGFVALRGKHFDMSTEESAQPAMESVVAALRDTDLSALDRISNAEIMLDALKAFTTRPWHGTFSQLQERWLRQDPELVSAASATRRMLKL